MNSKSIFKFAAVIAVFALIISASRLPLTTSERSSTPLWTYNLNDSDQLSAFLIVIVMSGVCIALGKFMFKDNDVIAHPLVVGGTIAMMLITILAYFINSLFISNIGSWSSKAITDGDYAFVTVLVLEWLAVMYYAWNKYKDDQSHNPSFK